ncbi:hypothetical protein BC936DRAFT_140729 [Jimgerdemannia flammicorona]|uniref:Uncharacterized protein n=1 Tax=Jimgerdemannia flammicorona TaxID=994334 RepID=A0A433ACL8_9FUNG|nr:hypothetical protein BC936DRAFT_140729 [Jimgerdemannia flammicorona]
MDARDYDFTGGLGHNNLMNVGGCWYDRDQGKQLRLARDPQEEHLGEDLAGDAEDHNNEGADVADAEEHCYRR